MAADEAELPARIAAARAAAAAGTVAIAASAPEPFLARLRSFVLDGR